MKYDFELFAEQKLLHLHCDAHPWMRAFVWVVDHTWFAVTGKDGRFNLTGCTRGATTSSFGTSATGPSGGR